jgi:hypothetical protein
MKPDKTAPDSDLSSIPGEFRENYRFLSELINCRERNDTATKTLETLLPKSPVLVKERLNRRQGKIFREFLEHRGVESDELSGAPVPAELEASIRIRQRSSWLPWEAEAIHKIDLWRKDVECISNHLAGDVNFSLSSKTLGRGRN